LREPDSAVRYASREIAVPRPHFGAGKLQRTYTRLWSIDPAKSRAGHADVAAERLSEGSATLCQFDSAAPATVETFPLFCRSPIRRLFFNARYVPTTPLMIAIPNRSPRMTPDCRLRRSGCSLSLFRGAPEIAFSSE